MRVRTMRRTAGSVLPHAVILGLIPAAGHAQLLQRYLPAAVPGYADDAVAAALQNNGPDYSSAGVRTGDFIIRPALNETIGYDENPLGLSGGRSSSKIESSASVGAVSDWARDQVGLSASIDDLRFPDLPIANQMTDTLFAGGRLDIGRASVDLSAGHVDSDLGPTDVFTQGLVAPVPYQSNDVRLSNDWHFNRLTLTPSVDFTTYRFGHSAGGAAAVDDTGLDKDQGQAAVTAQYEFFPGRTAVFVVQETQADFQHRAPFTPNPNYLDSLVLGGAEIDPQGLFGGSLLVGYERRSFGAAQFRTLSVPVVEATFTYLPSRLTTVTFSALRHLSDASYNIANNVTYTEGRARIAHNLRRNILLNVRADIARSDEDTSNYTHTQITAGADATWLVSRRVHVSLDYNFSHGDSGATPFAQSPLAPLFGGIAGSSNVYSASALTLSLHLQL